MSNPLREIQYMITFGELQRLTAVDASDIAAFVEATMMRSEVDPNVGNIDALMSLGVKLGGAGQSGSAHAALSWAARDPSPIRTEFASMFVNGLWRASRAVWSDVQSLIDLHAQVRLNPEQEREYILALAAAAPANTNDPSRSRLRSALVEAIRALEAGGTVDFAVREAVTRALTL